MSEFIDRQKLVIDRTGAGLLPGIGLALVIALGIIAAILIRQWWAVIAALAGIFIVTGVVVAILLAIIGPDDETYGHR